MGQSLYLVMLILFSIYLCKFKIHYVWFLRCFVKLQLFFANSDLHLIITYAGYACIVLFYLAVIFPIMSGKDVCQKYIASMIISGVGDAMGYRNGLWEFTDSGPTIHKDLADLGGLNNLTIKCRFVVMIN